MRRAVVFRLSLAFILCMAPGAPRADGAAEYTFGVVPQQATAKLARLWIPLVMKVSALSGVPLRFETAPDIPEFERRLADGRYDFAYMNPYHYTVFSGRPGYRALAKQRGKSIRGIVVVRRGDPVASLDGLAGETLAYPAPTAFAASVLPRVALARAGVTSKAQYVSSHDSVYRSVAVGLFPAGGGIERTFNSAPREVRDRLRVLWRSRPFTPHAFAAHPRVAKADAKAVGAALAGLDVDDEGRRVLSALGFETAIEPARDADWNDVRALGPDLLNDLVRDR